MENYQTDTITLKVENLKKYFPIKSGILGLRTIKMAKAVDGVDLTISKGDTYALVGESGSGKTTFAKTVLRIYKPDEGRIWLNGTEISAMKGAELKKQRRNMQMVFQELTSINPRRSVKSIVEAPLVIHKVYGRKERMKRLKELMNLVELSEHYLNRYPAALSGGEKQRVGIARAIALNPGLIILDEPTSSLDVSVQAKILSLLSKLQQRLNLTYLLITHNLAVVRNFSNKIAVMYLGRIMESCSTEELFGTPLHPYTRVLLSSIPTIFDRELRMLPEEAILSDEIPDCSNVPKGCRLHPRCPEKIGHICEREGPELYESRRNHFVRCHTFA